MTKPSTNHIVLLLVLSFLLALAGCKDAEKEELEAKLQAVQTALAEDKSQLADTQAKLDATQKERDGLKQELQNLKAQDTAQRMQMEQLKRQLSTADERSAIDKEALQTQVAALEQDLSQKKSLIARLQEQLQKLTGLQQENAKLQQIIDELKKKLGAEVKLPDIPLP